MRNSYNNIFEEKISQILRIDENMRWVHEKYREENPRGVWSTDWEELPENIKEANRNQVKSIPQKLLAIGCEIAVEGADECVSHFSNDEIKTLSRIEHDRWMLEKVSKGWNYGKKRNEAEKLHPSIVSWEALSQGEKQKKILILSKI